MAGRDTSRFDYLFEPIDGDLQSVGHDDAAAIESPTPTPPFPVVLAAAVVLGAGLGAGLVWSGPADAVGTPRPISTTAPSTPVVSWSPVVEPPSPSPSPLPSPVTAPTVTPAPPPPREETPPASPSTSSAPAPRTAPASTPTVRAPMSVSPAPRPAFPNQKPGDGADHRGILGGLL